MKRKAENNFEKLKAAHLSVQKKFEKLKEVSMRIGKHNLLLEKEVGLYDGILQTLRGVREECGRLERRLREGGGWCSVV